jgi:negative regulator of flagellin synthesis FlgM
MRIDLTNSAASQIAGEQQPKSVAGQDTLSPGAASTDDRTTFSSDKASVGALVSTAMQSPDIRQDKVASLQQAISNGQYQIDPEKIAASMIDEHA